MNTKTNMFFGRRLFTKGFVTRFNQLAVLVIVAAGCELVAARVAESGESAASKPPNIVLCLADDLGWAGVRYEKVFPFLQTPHLDTMARDAVRFDRFYAAAPWCSPTRVSLMTGRCPARYNSHKPGDGLPSEATTLAEILRQHNYTTAHYGKWHLGGKVSPHEQGYDDSLWTGNNSAHVNPTYTDHQGEKQKLVGEDCDLLVERTLKFLRSGVAADKPCFVTLWYHVPHSPDGTTQEFIDLYKDLPKEKDRVFWGQISALDASIGKLRRGLRELGIADNTLLFFCGDNGGVGGTSGKLRAAKGSLYEGGLRVPAVLEWPARFDKPTTCSVRCGTVDLLPTVLDAAGIPLPKDLPTPDGVSMIPLIDGRMKERSQPLTFYQPPGHDYTRTEGRFVVIQGKLKLLSNLQGDVELYDLESDPQEKTNIADSHRDDVAAMDKLLKTWADSIERDLKNASDQLRKPETN